MNSVVLDVVIGLIFIYLIYSLFISIVGEMISNWLGMRARILRQGITTMLTDHKEKSRGIFNIIEHLNRWFLREPADFRFSKAGEFYNQPSIKYLTRSTSNSIFFTTKGKPSYIANTNFSSTLINMLRTHGRGIHDWGKINFSIENNAIHLEPETHKHLLQLLRDSDDNMEVFIQKLEEWYEEMMDRVNGWYKRKVQFILFWIGFILVAILNVDTFFIVNKLSKDDNARNQMVMLALQAADSSSAVASLLTSRDSNLIRQELQKAYGIVNQDIHDANLLLGAGWGWDTLGKNVTVSRAVSADNYLILRNASDSLLRFQDSLGHLEAFLSNEKLHYIDLKKILLEHAQYREKITGQLQIINNQTDGNFISIESYTYQANVISITGKKRASVWQKSLFIISQVSPLKQKFWGLTITALALCLGAPFWFDLLQKLISLRSSGEKPKEQKSDKTSVSVVAEKSPLGKTIVTADPVEIAIEQNKKIWESIPGVLAVNSVLVTESGKQIPVIEITHNSDADTSRIPESISIELNQETVPVRIFKKASDYGEFMADLGVQGLGGKGTIAGILVNRRSNKDCLLSCAHVLSNSDSSLILEGNRGITNQAGVAIGALTEVIWSNFLDAAVADLNDSGKQLNLPKIPEPCDITPVDAFRSLEVTIRSKTGDKHGQIIHHQYNFPFFHKNRIYLMYNLITIGKRVLPDKIEKISVPGDSGALVVRKSDNRSIGIVVGGLTDPQDKSNLTFVLPMQQILQIMKLSIKP